MTKTAISTYQKAIQEKNLHIKTKLTKRVKLRSLKYSLI